MNLEKVENDISEVLYHDLEIRERLAELGKQITKDYQAPEKSGKKIVVISILKGGAFPLFDLIKYINIPLEVDFMTVSSYGKGTRTSGNVKIVMDLANDIKGKNVLIVEDIVDTGLTLEKLTEYLANKEPASIEICTLLRKKEALITDVSVKYVGFDIPNKFVVGWGFDYDQLYRNLDFIGVLNPEVYQNNGGQEEVYRRFNTNN